MMKPGDMVRIKPKNGYVYGYLYRDPSVTYYVRDLEAHETGVVLDVCMRGRGYRSFQVVIGGDTGWVEEKDVELLQ